MPVGPSAAFLSGAIAGGAGGCAVAGVFVVAGFLAAAPVVLAGGFLSFVEEAGCDPGTVVAGAAPVTDAAPRSIAAAYALRHPQPCRFAANIFPTS